MSLSAFSPESLARTSAAHPWRVVIVWILGIIISFAFIATLLASALTVEGQFTNSPDSKFAEELIEERIRPT
jgi:uncharacterized membrane protein YdfJ with MMPL/SSD domain